MTMFRSEFSALYSEWLSVRARHAEMEAIPASDCSGDKSKLLDDEMSELNEKETDLVVAICGTPVFAKEQILQKFDVMAHYHDGTDWGDRRDIRLAGSIQADLISLQQEWNP